MEDLDTPLGAIFVSVRNRLGEIPDALVEGVEW